jgi:Transcription factor WhiB
VNLVGLFDALAGVPRLPGAACCGRWKLFDSDDQADIAAATEICSRCPALSLCTEWVASLPPKHRPSGVVAGRIHIPVTPDQTRQRKTRSRAC